MTLRTSRYPKPEPRSKEPLVLKLFEILDERKITYGSFSAETGINVGTLRQWKMGRTHPKSKVLCRAFNVLGYRLEVVQCHP